MRLTGHLLSDKSNTAAIDFFKATEGRRYERSCRHHLHRQLPRSPGPLIPAPPPRLRYSAPRPNPEIPTMLTRRYFLQSTVLGHGPESPR